MYRLRLIFPFLFVSVLVWTQDATEAADDHPWCYKDPHCDASTWSGKCHTGKSQSPIDINPANTIIGRTTRRMRFNKEYMDVVDQFVVKNNGHTLQLSMNDQLTSPLMMDGDGMRGSYVFSQMHFHWGSHNDIGSEHTLAGTAYTAELHLVHYHERYDSLTAAVQDNNPTALTVLGIFLQIAKDDNVALKPILEALKSVTAVSDKSLTVNLPLNVSSLLPSDLGLYRYEGSLTTPGCAEVVLWNVFRHPITISESQVALFRSMKDSHAHGLVDNFRPTQNTNNRRVFEYGHERFEIKPGPNEIDDHKPVEHDLGHEDPPSGAKPPQNATTTPTTQSKSKHNSGSKLKAGAAAIFSLIFSSFTYLAMFLECFLNSLLPFNNYLY